MIWRDNKSRSRTLLRKRILRISLLAALLLSLISYLVLSVENIPSPAYPEGNLIGLIYDSAVLFLVLTGMVGVVALLHYVIRSRRRPKRTSEEPTDPDTSKRSDAYR